MSEGDEDHGSNAPLPNESSPRILWVIFMLKLIESYAYFAAANVVTIFLSDEFGMTDKEAGLCVGAKGFAVSVYGLALGWLVDRLGVRRSLLLGSTLSFVARGWLAFSTTKSEVYLIFYLLSPLGGCFTVPVLTLAIKGCTTTTNRAFAFGVFYSVMNVGVFISGVAVDVISGSLRPGMQAWPSIGELDILALYSVSGNRMIIFSGCLVSAIVFTTVLLLVPDDKKGDGATRHGDHDDIKNDVELAERNSVEKVVSTLPLLEERCASAASAEKLLAVVPEEVDVAGSDCTDTNSKDRSNIRNRTSRSTEAQSSQTGASSRGKFWRQKKLWRFMAFTIILVNLRSIFRHLDATLPKYMVREFGPQVAKGAVMSINSAMIIFLVPPLSAYSAKINNFDAIMLGAYITSSSVFVLAFDTSYMACVVFVIILSIGEALWSPRLYDYTITVAPHGQEGAFMAMATAPLFLSTLPVGYLSGTLLEMYCPAQGERHSKTMWLIIGLITATSPVLLTVTKRWIREPIS